MKSPSTLPEWEAYIGQMSGTTLYKQAISCNTQRFCDVLMDEGYSLEEVEKILVFFVRQLRATDTMIPTGGSFDLDYIACTDLVAMEGMTMTGEEADRLNIEPDQDGSPDEIDQFTQD